MVSMLNVLSYVELRSLRKEEEEEQNIEQHTHTHTQSIPFVLRAEMFAF